jgi:MFS family permease
MKTRKILALVLIGNIIDYFDFLLFAHLGFIITPVFIPNLSTKEAHLFSLILFALPFIVRPLGGYIFGRLADSTNRVNALSISIKWAGLAAMFIAYLPSYNEGGIICSIMFIFFRALQGLSLGGEYTTAGTFLMEHYKKNQGFISGLLGASGTIGSMLAFAIAWAYYKEWVPEEFWRVAFFMGGVVSLLSYFLRRYLHAKIPQEDPIASEKPAYANAVILTLLTGLLVGVTTWIPMAYSNFYLTKVLNLNMEIGLYATLISLVSYVVLTPLFGKLSDQYSAKSVMTIAALGVVPLSSIGFYLVAQEHLVGQVFLTAAAASFGAPLHVFINRLFSKQNRSKNVNFCFMTGTAVGSLVPGFSGYVSDKFQIEYMPVIILSVIGIVVFIIFSRMR